MKEQKVEIIIDGSINSNEINNKESTLSSNSWWNDNFPYCNSLLMLKQKTNFAIILILICFPICFIFEFIYRVPRFVLDMLFLNKINDNDLINVLKKQPSSDLIDKGNIETSKSKK